MNRGRSGIAGFVEMFCVGQADHGFVKRRGLGCNGSLVQGLPVVGRTEFKGKMRFEPCVKNDGVVLVTERFQAFKRVPPSGPDCVPKAPACVESR